MSSGDRRKGGRVVPCPTQSANWLVGPRQVSPARKTNFSSVAPRARAHGGRDDAKKSARLARAKDAHDTLVATAHRAQARALEIESQAKMRLADEYNAAQERGEVQKPGGDRKTLISSRNNGPTVADIGPTAQQVH